MISRFACCAALLALAACSGGSEEAEPAPSPSPTLTSDAPSEPRNLVASDFGELKIGPKIEGPVGPEVEASIVAGGRSIGDIVSYVACPEEYDTCDPEDMPEGTVYTYVHIVTPGTDEPNDPPFTRPVGLDEVEEAPLFATLREAVAFYTGGRGHAVPEGEQLSLHCNNWEPNLTDEELDLLVEFLHTLTDESFMPALPDAVPSGLPPVLGVKLPST